MTPEAFAGAKAPADVLPILRISGLSKQYGGVRALDGVSLDVQRGSVHAVIGENGAGKSTLMKIIAGATAPDRGQISIDGSILPTSGPVAASRAGIGIVYQELSTLPTRDVLANLFVNNEPGYFGFVSRRKMAAAARPVFDQLGLDLNFDERAGDLSVANRQLLEIARVLISKPRVILLDEPNSALNARETARLFDIIRELCARQVTVIYVSHRLEEVFEIADTVTVMRNGHLIWTRPRAQLTIPQVIDAMLGHRAEDQYPPPLEPQTIPGAPLRVVGLRLPASDHAISFDAAPGEILGVAGLDGSGSDSLLPVLFGMQTPASDSSVYPDGLGRPLDPHAAARRRIALVPADRRREGLMLDKSIAVNAAHVAVGANSPWWRMVSNASLAERAQRAISALAIKAQSAHSLVHHLSGGNQQKVVVGKWLEIGPDVVLLDDPTRGIDVGAKRELFGVVRKLQSQNKIILIRSTELGELLGMCDRILVLYRRRLAGIARAEGLSEKRLLEAINTGVVGSGLA
jgi:ribose transport system ATP-binding protein